MSTSHVQRTEALESELSRLEQRYTYRPRERTLLDGDPRNDGFATLLTAV